MRKALLVGIDDYAFGPLGGCVSDANRMYNILSRDYDDTPNFASKKLVSTDTVVTIDLLKDSICDLLQYDCQIALFYFSGHGSESTKSQRSCLVTQDATSSSSGVDLSFLIEQVNCSKAKEVVIILDCCFSGSAGNLHMLQNLAELREGVSILTSSNYNEVSLENRKGGVFTSIVYDALNGGATDTLGNVTVGSIYTFADKLLGPWDQRPIFKSYVTRMTSIRRCKPQVPLETLRKLPKLFPTADHYFQLDSSFEPEAEPRDQENEKAFAELQKLNRVGLLLPTDEEHMYHAAINQKTCHLTPLGKYYWQLAYKNKI